MKITRAFRPLNAFFYCFLQEEQFDVAIIDGGVLGLATALNLAKKWNVKRIVVLESEQIDKPLEIAPFHLVHHHRYLSQLGQLAVPMWRELEKEGNIPHGSLLNTLNSFLYIGQAASTMAEICRNLSIAHCSQLSSTQITNEYPFITVNHPGVRLSESGFVNGTLLLQTLRALVAQTPNILVREKETFLNLQRQPNGFPVHIETSRGSLNASKVIFLPGAHTKNTMATLGIHLNINVYELPSAYYFPLLPTSSTNMTLPTWRYVSDDDDHYAGYPLDQKSGYVRIEPRISRATMQPLNSSNDRTNKPNQQIMSRLLTWVGQHLAGTVDSAHPILPMDTVLDSMLIDQGFVLDYVPGFGQQLVLGTDGWSSIQYMPMFAEILARLVANNGSSAVPADYASLLPEFSIHIKGRIVLPDPNPEVTRPPNGSAHKIDGAIFAFLVLLTHLFFILHS